MPVPSFDGAGILYVFISAISPLAAAHTLSYPTFRNH